MILNILIYALPDRVPSEMQKAIESLKKTKSREECLKKAYGLLTKKFRGKMFYFLTHFPGLFLTNLETIWNHTRVLNCNVMNYLMRTLLVKSGKFEDSEIKNKWTIIKLISPHQYLQVKLGKKTVNIDIWGGTRGLPLGKYSH